MGLRIKTKGNWTKTKQFLERAKDFNPLPVLQKYGEIGVQALSSATPVDTGLTAASWYYTIEKTGDGYILEWNNSNVVNDWLNVAIIIQYGHATANGAYVQAVDYINPALEDVFKDISVQIWREVSK